MNEAFKQEGYSFSLQPPRKEHCSISSAMSFSKIVLAGLVAVVLVFFLQKAGISKLVTVDSRSTLPAFFCLGWSRVSPAAPRSSVASSSPCRSSGALRTRRPHEEEARAAPAVQRRKAHYLRHARSPPCSGGAVHFDYRFGPAGHRDIDCDDHPGAADAWRRSARLQFTTPSLSRGTSRTRGNSEGAHAFCAGSAYVLPALRVHHHRRGVRPASGSPCGARS